jgi:hypothetical protein
MRTAVYVLNRTPIKSVEGSTPFEVWCDKMLELISNRLEPQGTKSNSPP